MSLIRPPRPKRQRLFVKASEQQRRLDSQRKAAAQPRKPKQ